MFQEHRDRIPIYRLRSCVHGRGIATAKVFFSIRGLMVHQEAPHVSVLQFLILHYTLRLICLLVVPSNDVHRAGHLSAFLNSMESVCGSLLLALSKAMTHVRRTRRHKPEQ